MKTSPQVQICDAANASRYSPLQVLRSAAGYYIGTVYHNEDGFDEPGSRDSEYFATAEEAQHALDTDSYNERLLP